MKQRRIGGRAMLALWVSFFGTASATSLLYPTGPTEDSAFVRFVQALPDTVVVETERGAKVTLTPEQRDTPWQAVAARTPLRATLRSMGRQEVVSVTVQPGEFVTVAAVPDAGSSWRLVQGREKPADFSALNVSLGVLNASARCPSATVKVAGRDTVVLANVTGTTVQRRQLNAVPLAVALWCGERSAGQAADLGVLRAGQRWTLLVVDEGTSTRLIPVLDRMP